MKFSIGLIVVVVAIAFFYFRVAMLRGRKKRYEREYALKRRKVNGRSKGSPLPEKKPWTPPFIVTSWILVALSMILILAGVVIYNNFSIFGIDLVKDAAFVAAYTKYWYFTVAAGVILLSLCINIEKPKLD